MPSNITYWYVGAASQTGDVYSFRTPGPTSSLLGVRRCSIWCSIVSAVEIIVRIFFMSFFSGPFKNLAYGRETYQSSTYETAISGKGVDGISNSQWGGGSCASTNPEHHPYWYVDLGKEHIIERIRITNRGDCCPERLHDVDVTVAGHNKKFDVVCGTFRGPGKASEKVVVQCPKRTKGRYVRLQITKGSNNVLTVCEVEVMGR
ncbi:hypothetical protein FSP39_015127 [Pinctada imbricata]|uniref:F5/8 type C domain-containing protein n=1 Tax=Pinctada imbricata TaxID=66713 RepID=A0AA88XHB4_PINIB|nr:hypothetical protein FSP39_015127 [Pinctada imbricata]